MDLVRQVSYHYNQQKEQDFFANTNMALIFYLFYTSADSIHFIASEMETNKKKKEVGN